MPEKKQSLSDKLDKYQRRRMKRIKRREQRAKIANDIKQQRFSKLVVVGLFLLTVIFTIAIIVVFLVSGGNEPSTLISGFFDFVKWEAGGLSLIKVAEKFNGSDKKKIKNVITDSVEIIEGVQELVDDTTDIITGEDSETY